MQAIAEAEGLHGYHTAGYHDDLSHPVVPAGDLYCTIGYGDNLQIKIAKAPRRTVPCPPAKVPLQYLAGITQLKAADLLKHDVTEKVAFVERRLGAWR
jgi:hypothetical protein